MKKYLLMFFFFFFFSSNVLAGQKSKEDARYDKACEALGYGMSDGEWEEALIVVPFVKTGKWVFSLSLRPASFC